MLQVKRLNGVEALINLWKTILQIEDWDIKTEKISIYQVSDHFCRIGHQFVGVSQDRINKLATIHHTRILVEEDIIHELLHVRYPGWSEEQVVSYTNLLMRKKGERNEILQRETKTIS